jgi:hypothetical protein
MCAHCQSETIAKCGEHNIWHWAHKSKDQCDPWSEAETEWHRTWKNCFPEEWHEISQFDPTTGEQHIADVRTDNGLVLEFQHSVIAPDEVRSREEFYGNMIWVVDGRRSPNNVFYFETSLSRGTQTDSLAARRRRTSDRSSGQLTIEDFDLSDDQSEDTTVPVSTDKPAGAPSELERPIHWQGRTKIFHDWSQATKPVYIDFGNGILWQLMKFDPLTNKGIVRAAWKRAKIEEFTRGNAIAAQ